MHRAEFPGALGINPEDGDAHWRLGCVLEAKGDLDGAELSFRRALEIDKEDGYAHCCLDGILDLDG